MIPTRLELKQFLCYREPVAIDFTGLRLACLCGDNGAGKSALLDAMTWALWERARADTSYLVSLGELDTRVVFSFFLDDTEYRVIRGYTATGRTRSLLELHVRRDREWYPLASGGKQAVQREIDRLLGISYTTFTNSVFLVQGKADEFTRQSPAKRKEILAELLELERYERYRELARQEGKRLREEGLRREQELELLRARAAAVPELRAIVLSLENSVESQAEQVQRLRAQVQVWHERKQRLALEIERYRERQKRLADLQSQLERLRRDEHRIGEELRQYRLVVAREVEILERSSEFERVRRELDDLAAIAGQRQQLIDLLRRTERALETRRREILAQLQTVEIQIEQRKRELDRRHALSNERAHLHAQLADIATRHEEHRTLCDRVTELQTRRAELTTIGKQLRKELDELRSQLKRLEEMGAVCPTCLRPLTDDDRRRQRSALEHRLAALRQEFEERRVEVVQLDAELTRVQQRRDEVEQSLRSELSLRTELGRLDALLQRLDTIERELEALYRQRQDLERALREDAQIAGLTQQLTELERRLAEVPYDPDRHAQLQQRAQALQSAQEDLRALEHARTMLRIGEQRLHELAQRCLELERELTALESELAASAPPERDLAEVEAELVATQSALAHAEQRLHATQAELGAARQRLRDAEDAAVQARTLETVIERIQREIRVLTELELAFGKEGIQALILENVLPELADATNDILDRLPGNTLRVDFATQRDRASGRGAIETLDILISDEFGQRPYELYSGGEAFRINFALRVALSLLLAHRAGRRLETLVIDEGFGTQDAKGREGLIQALQSVQDQFALILVITHIEELKEQFPQRIEVYKTPSGSRVSVLA